MRRSAWPRSRWRKCLDPLGLNVIAAARVLGVARHILSRVLNRPAAISPEMAIRLEKAGWSNAEFWLRQTTYDLVQARKREDGISVERYERRPTVRGVGRLAIGSRACSHRVYRRPLGPKGKAAPRPHQSNDLICTQ